MLAKANYQENPVKYYLIRISSGNPHSKHVFEKMGVIPIGTAESIFKTFMNSFKSTMGDVEMMHTEIDRLVRQYSR